MTLFVRTRFVAGVVAAVVMMTLFHTDDAHARLARRGFDLFAVPRNLMLRANRVQCNINDVGELCVDPTNSPSTGGGFWPRGTGDQYLFNGGINFAARIMGTPQTGFPWPGDTVGGWFMDLRGDQNHGESLTRIADGLSVSDLLRWPGAARASDPALFAPALLGRPTVSDQDSWVRYWDGGTGQDNGRKHPAGVMVDQRTLSFDTPGLEDVVFVIYRLINVTARNPAAYQQLAAAGYSADAIAEIAALGGTFQDRMERKYQIQIPDDGYPLDSMYVSYDEDPDVASAGTNYSNANLVFASSVAYAASLREPTWQYPADVFAPPFAQAPGFVANAFLRTPPSLIAGAPRIWFSGNFTGGAPFPNAVGVSRLWRNDSGHLLPADGTCSVVSALTRHFCFWTQTPTDTRYFMSTGPLRLAPGESAVLISAHVFAPAIEAVIAPFIGALPGMIPGYPVDGARLLNGADTLRVLDRAAGWVSHANLNGNGAIEANEVVTTPRSLFWKIQAAQAALDRGFLMPSAPLAPDFYPVPGDHRVTVAWRPSVTEASGDPYFPIAADPTTPLYDPDYRQYDVEGYRIWRGTSPDNMQVIAQFDYSGTTLADVTGQVVDFYSTTCAPELGVTTNCPAFPYAKALAGNVVQVRLGDRVRLQNGAVVVLQADTAVVGGGSGRGPLRDTGLPFIYVDSTARNGQTYLYAVSAFDVNSVRSGASTLESPPTVKSATPRVPASNAQTASVVIGLFGSDGTTPLNPDSAFPAIDAANGTFNGIIPPANGGSFQFIASLAEALPLGDYTARIDSVTGGTPPSIFSATVPVVYMTFSAPGVTQALSFPMFSNFVSHADPPNQTSTFATRIPLIPFDTGRARRAGIPSTFSSGARMQVDFRATFEPLSGGPSATMLCGRGLVSQGSCGGGATIQASRYLLHSRWYDEGKAEPADPTIDFNPSGAHNSGSLTGVQTIWNPMPYRVPLAAGGQTQVPALFRYYAYSLSVFHPADFVVTWGAGAQITVRDSTHRTDLPFRADLGAGYGFVSGATIAAAGITTATLQFGGQELGAPAPAVPSYHSLYTIRPVCNGALLAALAASIPCANLSKTAVLQGIDLSSPVDGVPDGNGIVLVINGEAFFMQIAALPAAGTKWHLKAIGGLGMTASCTPSLGTAVAEIVTPPADCSGYAYTSPNTVRPPAVPGLQYKIRVTAAIDTAGARNTMAAIHTVPDPYYLTNSLETAPGQQVLRFVNLPDRAIIRIYSAGGALTAILSHNESSGGGEQAWDLRSRSGRAVASGVYFFHVEAADGQTKVGRFVVVNRAEP